MPRTYTKLDTHTTHVSNHHGCHHTFTRTLDTTQPLHHLSPMLTPLTGTDEAITAAAAHGAEQLRARAESQASAMQRLVGEPGTNHHRVFTSSQVAILRYLLYTGMNGSNTNHTMHKALSDAFGAEVGVVKV